MSLIRIISGPAASLLSGPVSRYIISQRDRLATMGTALSGQYSSRLGDYFGATDLNRVRMVQIDPLPMPAPPFYRTARTLGLDFPDLSLAAAITFDYVIAARERLTTTLLFHELVHVVQFRLLGVSAFARLYTRGFLSGRTYDGIPLERCAAELDRRFIGCSSPFDVELEVKAWMAGGLF